MKTLTPEQIAQICHETNRAYCEALGDRSQLSWGHAPDWQRASAIKGVEFHLANPDASPSASHESWLAEKAATGWKYGPTKNSITKEHPCFVPFSGLPPEQQAKDVLFKSVVEALRGLVVRAETIPAGQVDPGVAEPSPLPPPLSCQEVEVIENKSLRRDTDLIIQRVKALPPSRERSISITKLQESVMWLGMDLKRLNEPNPYPNSKDPSNTKIEATADGLKL